LVPTYWSTICQDHDPARFSIIHDIFQNPGSAMESSSTPEQGYLILSVEYRFMYPASPYSSPQLSPVDSLSSTNSSLPSPSSFTGYDYSSAYSPVSRHERLYTAQSNVMADMCYPDAHHLSSVSPYGQHQVYDGSSFPSAVESIKGLCASEQSQPSQLTMPPGYLNHYVSP